MNTHIWEKASYYMLAVWLLHEERKKRQESKVASKLSIRRTELHEKSATSWPNSPELNEEV